MGHTKQGRMCMWTKHFEEQSLLQAKLLNVLDFFLITWADV